MRLRWKKKEKAFAGGKTHTYPNFCLQISMIWLLSFGPHCPDSIAWSFLSYGLCLGYFLSKILFSCLFSPLRLASHLISIPVSREASADCPVKSFAVLCLFSLGDSSVSPFSKGMVFSIQCVALVLVSGIMVSPYFHVGPKH